MQVGDKVRYTGTDDFLRGKTGVYKGLSPRHSSEYLVEFNGQMWSLMRDTFMTVPQMLAEAAGIKKPALPTDSAERKRWPLFSGLLAYFPAALARVSHHSYLGNEKHNPGQPLNHARGKSGDHEDCIVRHLVDASEHPAGSEARLEELSALAWRALALLQEECERAGHRVAPAATFNKD